MKLEGGLRGEDRQEEGKCHGHRAGRGEGGTADTSHLPLDCGSWKPVLSPEDEPREGSISLATRGHLRKALSICQGQATPWHLESPPCVVLEQVAGCVSSH